MFIKYTLLSKRLIKISFIKAILFFQFNYVLISLVKLLKTSKLFFDFFIVSLYNTTQSKTLYNILHLRKTFL